jgi:hypothetical protein
VGAVRGASFWGSGRTWGGGLRGRTALPNIMWGLFTGNSESLLKGGSGNGASLSMGALLEEPGGWSSFARGPEGYERKALGMGTSPHGGSVGHPEVGSCTGDFEMWLKGDLGVECPSLWELCEGSLEGGLPCWGP